MPSLKGTLDPSNSFILLDPDGVILDSGDLLGFGLPASHELVDRPLDEVFEPVDPERSIVDSLQNGQQLLRRKVSSNGQGPVLCQILKGWKGEEFLLLLSDPHSKAMDPAAERELRKEMSREMSAVLETEIAEHQNTQVELHRVKGLAQSMINSSLDMMIAVDDNNGVTEFNNAAQQKFGYSLEEVLGKDTSRFYADPTQYDQVLSILHQHGSFEGEIVNRTKTGETFVAYLSASRIIDVDGKEIGSMGISRDVTNIKKAEKETLVQAAKINAIFQSSAKMMIWTLDQDHKISSYNESFKRTIDNGLGVELNIGDDFLSEMKPFVPANKYKEYKSKYIKALTGEPQEFEGQMTSAKGEEIWVETFLSPIKIEGGGILEISCLAHEVTDKKQAFKKIRTSLKEKDILLKEVHHRVKNNLQVISSILNLQSSYIDDEHTLQLLKESQSRIKSMSYVHESLYQNKDLAYIDISDYVVGLTRNLIHSYGNNKEIDLRSKLSKLELNLDQAIPCGLLLNELITNALKYAYPNSDKGELFIEVGEKNGKALLRVADNGIGLPSDLIIEEAPSLGLQLVSTLVEQLDGKVELEPKRGTNYLITFDRIK